jgi:hypothetical protein
MNARTLLFAVASAAPIVLAAHGPAPRLKFAPEEGSSLTKTIENKATLSLDEFTVTGTGGQAPSMEMTMTLHQKVVVTDQYVKMREGAPQKLVRSFDDMSGEASASMKSTVLGEKNTHDQNIRSKSALEGKKVVFEWDPDEKTYKKAFDPEEEDENEVLKGLDENMDFRQVLPAGEVKEGDQWDIPLGSVRTIFAPGGNLAMVPETADATSTKPGTETSSMSNMMGDKLEGTATGTLAGIVTVEGVQCARIHLALDVKSSLDMTDVARKNLESTGEQPGFELQKVGLDFGFQGDGEVVWDLSAGHFRSLDVSGQMSIRTSQSSKFDIAGKSITVDETKSFSGRSSCSAKAR